MNVVLFRVNLMVSVRSMERQIAAMRIWIRHRAHLLLGVHLFACSLRCQTFWPVFSMLSDVSSTWRTSSTEAVLWFEWRMLFSFRLMLAFLCHAFLCNSYVLCVFIVLLLYCCTRSCVCQIQGQWVVSQRQDLEAEGQGFILRCGIFGEQAFSYSGPAAWNQLPGAYITAATDALVIPPTRLSTIGDRAFPIVAAQVWNSSPVSRQQQRSTHLSNDWKLNFTFAATICHLLMHANILYNSICTLLVYCWTTGFTFWCYVFQQSLDIMPL